ncbi:MAG: hypothetical protein CMH77_03375 [Nitrospinae bacterium]|nr:hypothetical protein [Nitrospinota bacterium]
MNNNKFENIIRPGKEGDVVLLGFPHDEGVAINKGRPGAKHGPEKFRFWINKYDAVGSMHTESDLSNLIIADAGDISPNLPLEEAHSELTFRTREILQSDSIPFVVGGSNDQSYPNASALLDKKSEQVIGVINVDAHLDVRPLKKGRAHSGSPFRLLLEDERFFGNHFVEFASQGNQCSSEHTQFVLGNYGSIYWLEEICKQGAIIDTFRSALGKLAKECQSIFVSFDLDSIAGNDAPGVSCPGVTGLNADEATAIAFHAGEHPAVELFDLSEYNPVIEDERTGRLAASIFHQFCLGYLQRKQK